MGHFPCGCCDSCFGEIDYFTRPGTIPTSDFDWTLTGGFGISGGFLQATSAGTATEDVLGSGFGYMTVDVDTFPVGYVLDLYVLDTATSNKWFLRLEGEGGTLGVEVGGTEYYFTGGASPGDEITFNMTEVYMYCFSGHPVYDNMEAEAFPFSFPSPATSSYGIELVSLTSGTLKINSVGLNGAKPDSSCLNIHRENATGCSNCASVAVSGETADLTFYPVASFYDIVIAGSPLAGTYSLGTGGECGGSAIFSVACEDGYGGTHREFPISLDIMSGTPDYFRVTIKQGTSTIGIYTLDIDATDSCMGVSNATMSYSSGSGTFTCDPTTYDRTDITSVKITAVEYKAI